MANENVKSRKMRVRNANRTSADDRTNPSFREAPGANPAHNTKHGNNDIVGDGGAENDAVSSSVNAASASVNNDKNATIASGRNNATKGSFADGGNNENSEVNYIIDSYGYQYHDEDGDMSEEIDRSGTVTVVSLGKTFPAPDEYDYIGIVDDPYL